MQSTHNAAKRTFSPKQPVQGKQPMFPKADQPKPKEAQKPQHIKREYTKHISNLKFKVLMLLLALIIAFVVVEASLVMTVYQTYAWIAPLVLFLNVGATWLLIHFVILRVMVFPLSLWFVKIPMRIQLNRAYCRELSRLSEKALDAIKNQMSKPQHQDLDMSQYNDATQQLTQLMTFVKTYAAVNEKVLEDKSVRQRQNFVEVTKLMTELLESAKRVILVPVFQADAKERIAFYDYYTGEYQRLYYDTRPKSSEAKLVRSLPIVHKSSTKEMSHLVELLTRFLGVLESNQRRSCCCCRVPKYERAVLFGSYTQLGKYLELHYQTKRVFIEVAKGVKLDCMLFKAQRQYAQNGGSSIEEFKQEDSSEEYRSRPTIIFCNSNAMYYQQMVHQSHNFYLNLFLQKGVNVFCWNYRGYGESGGRPTPQNLCSDADIVLKYVKEDLKLGGQKIAVYGRSLGGIPASHLQQKVDMAIIDRTFSSLDAIATTRYNSKALPFLIKVCSIDWQVLSDENAVKLRPQKDLQPTYKVIMQDKQDNVVSMHSSLMVGIARVLVRQQLFNSRKPLTELPYLSKASAQELIQNLQDLMSIESALFQVISAHYANQQRPHKHNKQVKQVSQKTKNKRAELYIQTDDLEANRAKHRKLSKGDLKTLSKLKVQVNPDDSDLITVQTTLSRLVNSIESLSGGIISLNEVINVNKKAKIDELMDFFMMAEVYGSQTLQQGRQSAPAGANYLTDMRVNTLNQLSIIVYQLQCAIKLDSQTVKQICLRLENIFKPIHTYWSQKLKAQQGLFQNQGPSLDQVGHLINLKCGHNGKPSMAEISILTYHITQANFLPPFESPSYQNSESESESLQNPAREDNEIAMQRKISYDDPRQKVESLSSGSSDSEQAEQTPKRLDKEVKPFDKQDSPHSSEIGQENKVLTPIKLISKSPAAVFIKEGSPIDNSDIHFQLDDNNRCGDVSEHLPSQSADVQKYQTLNPRPVDQF